MLRKGRLYWSREFEWKYASWSLEYLNGGPKKRKNRLKLKTQKSAQFYCDNLYVTLNWFTFCCRIANVPSVTVIVLKSEIGETLLDTAIEYCSTPLLLTTVCTGDLNTSFATNEMGRGGKLGMWAYLFIAQVDRRCYSGSAIQFHTRTDQRNLLDNPCSRYRRYIDPLSLRAEDLKSLDVGFLP